MSRLLRWTLAASIATNLGTCPASAQVERYLRRDSLLIARDLDGDGHVDFVVLEVRRTAYEGFENRMAIYLDQSPASRRPNWASGWDYEGLGQYHLDAVAMATDVGLLDVAFYGGDADTHTILLVRNRTARVDIEHQVDYGRGYLTIRREGSTVVIDASVDNLVLRGVNVPSGAPCSASEWAMIRLRYDHTRRRFVPGKRFCVRAQ